MKKLIGIIAAMLFVGIIAACNGTVPAEFNEKDMIFVHDGVEYPMGSNAAPLIKMFGDDYEEVASPSCQFVGDDKLFSYSFASVYTYPMEDVDLIDEIYIYGGEYKTSRGIGLGSTKEEVVAEYGENYFDDGISIYYVVSGAMEDTNSPRLFFELNNGVVSGISYFGAASINQ